MQINYTTHTERVDIIISHGGSGEVNLCLESDGYEDECDEFPLRYIVGVEDADLGHEFNVCYEIEDSNSDSKVCREYEFTGSDEQVIDFYIPDYSYSGLLHCYLDSKMNSS